MMNELLERFVKELENQGPPQGGTPQQQAAAPAQSQGQNPEQNALAFLKAVQGMSFEDLNAVRHAAEQEQKAVAAAVVIERMIAMLQQELEAINKALSGEQKGQG